ncbi:MAG: heat-inducible transcription repressor HrcA [SAR202 cluster bacterium]|nr:heat-inducible transcription repressor HrcA [SAR202 cluster bacterium]
MVTRESLSERRQQILRIVVGEYVSTAVPVSSDVVTRRQVLKVSPATVRNDMAELETEGFIRRPHVSAGGMPSDKGYRYYVEYLAEPEQLPGPVKDQIIQQLRAADRDMDSWIEMATSLLAKLANSVAIITFPRAPEPRLQHVELVYLQDLLALVVLVVKQTRVRKELVTLLQPVSREELQHASARLSALYEGRTWHEIKSSGAEVSPLEYLVTEQVASLMRDEELALNEGYVEGLRMLLEQPEFADQPRVAKLAGLLESKRIQALTTALAPDGDEPRVLIGEENEEEALKSFSLVLGRYGLPGEATGTLGIIGPTRLHYERAVAGVRYFSGVLRELLGQVHGRSGLG